MLGLTLGLVERATAAVLALACAGSNLGWNLGHNDFAAVGRARHYRGVQVTLTGVGGAIGPPAGMLVYQWLEAAKPGTGAYSLARPPLFVTAGACGFAHAARHARARERRQ